MIRTIALSVSNQQRVNSKPWKEYVVPVDEVEWLTGYDFFENVAESVQEEIESEASEMVGTNMPQFETPTF
ncbi:DNA/RNA non-specific endonuclease [Leptolyngbya sp. AN03gr2]|uniref:DNA/RNA non-specific endonuclease n=1 Tax=unclassified Leptolyngbya TaxID=2650499 RepID=UPI003D3244D4